jgi:hypothetical protein
VLRHLGLHRGKPVAFGAEEPELARVAPLADLQPAPFPVELSLARVDGLCALAQALLQLLELLTGLDGALLVLLSL